GGMEAELLEIKERPWRELMSREFGKQEFPANLAQMTEKPGEDQGRGARETKHVHGIGVVADHHRARLSWSGPQALFAEGHCVIAHLHARVHIQWIEAVDLRNRSRRWRRDSGQAAVVIHVAVHKCLLRVRQSSPAGRMLVLSADIPEEPARHRAERRTRIEVAALIEGPAEVIPDGLPEVVAVA